MRHSQLRPGKMRSPRNPLALFLRSGWYPFDSSVLESFRTVPTYSPCFPAQSLHEVKRFVDELKALGSRWQHSSIQADTPSSASR
jgi:hypothetical protein